MLTENLKLRLAEPIFSLLSPDWLGVPMQEAGLTTVTVFIDPAQKIYIARSRPRSLIE
jgi:hypothetical protein